MRAPLQRLSTQEAQLGGCRRHAFAHHGTAQRTDVLEEKEAEPPRPLQRQEVREKAAVQEIDRERAAADVDASRGVISIGHLGRPDIAAGAMGGDDDLGNRGGIAQAEIEPLRADRRQEMGGLPDERYAPIGEPSRPLDRERKQPMLAIGRNLSQDRMRAPFGGKRWAASPTSATRRSANRRARSTASGNSPCSRSGEIFPRIECERRSISCASASASSAAMRAACASSTTITRLERSPGSGTSVNGPVVV